MTQQQKPITTERIAELRAMAENNDGSFETHATPREVVALCHLAEAHAELRDAAPSPAPHQSEPFTKWPPASGTLPPEHPDVLLTAAALSPAPPASSGAPAEACQQVCICGHMQSLHTGSCTGCSPDGECLKFVPAETPSETPRFTDWLTEMWTHAERVYKADERNQSEALSISLVRFQAINEIYQELQRLVSLGESRPAQPAVDPFYFLGKVLEGAVAGDRDKSIAYALHYAVQLEAAGCESQAKQLRDVVAGTARMVELAAPSRPSTTPPASSGAPADRTCLLCGDKESTHTKKEADWRTVPGCTGRYAAETPSETPLGAWLMQQREDCQKEINNQHNDGMTRRIYTARDAAYQAVQSFLLASPAPSETPRFTVDEIALVIGDYSTSQFRENIITEMLTDYLSLVQRLVSEPPPDSPQPIIESSKDRSEPIFTAAEVADWCHVEERDDRTLEMLRLLYRLLLAQEPPPARTPDRTKEQPAPFTPEQIRVYAGLRLSLRCEQTNGQERDWSDTAIILARQLQRHEADHAE